MAADASAVLAAAWDQAMLAGFASVSRRTVAPRLGISIGGVSSYPGGMDGLRDALVRLIIDRRHVPLLAQALAAGHPGALAAPIELREAAGRAVAGI